MKRFFGPAILFLVAVAAAVSLWAAPWQRPPADTAPNPKGSPMEEGPDKTAREGIRTKLPDIPKGEDRILIDKSDNRLYLFKDGELIHSYPVATGEDPKFTPEGTFAIANKVKEPRGPDLENSPLGNRWLGLAVPNQSDRRGPPDDVRAPRGLKYGIHGTNEPKSIGKHASKGCVRMNNEDVTALFDEIDVGTEVVIRP